MGKRKDNRKKPRSSGESLSSKQLSKKEIAKDGSCLFRAVAEQVENCQAQHLQVRHRCANYIAEHKERFNEFLPPKVGLESYVEQLKNPNTWGGEIEVVALSNAYDRSIVVYSDEFGEKIFTCPTEESKKNVDELTNPIRLAFDANHYDSVWTNERKEATIFCQSIVLEVVNRVLGQVGEPSGGDDDVMYKQGTTAYHNFPFEAYQRQKADMEMNNHAAAVELQFKVGDDCDVQVGSEIFLAKVLQLNVSPRNHKVLITHTNEERVVSYSHMKISSHVHQGEARTKSTNQQQQWSTAHSKASSHPNGTKKNCWQREANKQVGESPGAKTPAEQHGGQSSQEKKKSSTGPEAPCPGGAPQKALPAEVHPMESETSSASLEQNNKVHTKKLVDVSPKQTEVPRPSVAASIHKQTTVKNSSLSPHHSHRYTSRVVPTCDRNGHTSFGSISSDDSDPTKPSNGTDEEACQLKRVMAEIPGQLAAWGEEDHCPHKLQTREMEPRGLRQHRALRVEEDRGDVCDEWPLLDEENKLGKPGFSVPGVGTEVNGEYPSSSLALTMTTLETKDAVLGARTGMVVPELAMLGATTFTDASQAPSVPLESLIPPCMEGLSPNQFATLYSLQCLQVFLTRGGGGCVDLQAAQQMVSQLQNLLNKSSKEMFAGSVPLSFPGSVAPPINGVALPSIGSVALPSNSVALPSPGSVAPPSSGVALPSPGSVAPPSNGVALPSLAYIAPPPPQRLNNEEENFLVSLAKSSGRVTPVHQLEDPPNKQHHARMVTGRVSYDSDAFTHQAFLPDLNHPVPPSLSPPPSLPLPPMEVPPTSVPSTSEAIPPLLRSQPLPNDCSNLHLQSSSPIFAPPDGVAPFDMFSPQGYLGPMIPPQMLQRFGPPFPLWPFPALPPQMMLHQPHMISFGGGGLPYPHPCPPSTQPEDKLPSSQPESQGEEKRREGRGEEVEERKEAEERKREEEEKRKEEEEMEGIEEQKLEKDGTEKTKMESMEQPCEQSVVTAAANPQIPDVDTQQSMTLAPNKESEKMAAETSPPMSSASVPLPSLPRRPAITSNHNVSAPPLPSTDVRNKEESVGKQEQSYRARISAAGQGRGRDNFKTSSKGTYRGKNYRHPIPKHEVEAFDMVRGASNKTSVGDHSSQHSSLPFQSYGSGDHSPSHQQHNSHHRSHPRQPFHHHNHHPSVDDQIHEQVALDTDEQRGWVEYDYDVVVTNQQKMLDRYHLVGNHARQPNGYHENYSRPFASSKR